MTTERGPILLMLARNTIAQTLGERTRPHADPDWLDEPGATFVTLTQHGALRGCVGSLEAERALRADVSANAYAAAFRDSRFAPLNLHEYPYTDIELSLLSPLEAIEFASEEQAFDELRPGMDGVVFECGLHRSTFLPQVWRQFPEPRLFLAHLKQKAGLPAGFWSPEVKLRRYTVAKWCEQDFVETRAWSTA
jgi:AmmeMemoRadiSam system protein A